MSKKNVVFLAVIILLGLILYFHSKKQQEKIEQNIKNETKTLFKKGEADNISELKIENLKSKTTNTLQKQNGKWIVKEKNYPAQQSPAQRACDILQNIRFGQKIGAKTDELIKKYELDKGIKVSAGGKTFVLGKNLGGRVALLFNNTIYISPSNIKTYFKRYDNDWREKDLFFGKTGDDVKDLKISYKEKKKEKRFEFSKDDKDNIKVVGVKNGDSEKVSDFFRTLAGLRVAKFLDSKEETVDFNEIKKGKKTIKEPIKKEKIEITFKNNEKHTLNFLGKKTKNGDFYLVDKDGSIFGISKYYYNQVVNYNFSKK